MNIIQVSLLWSDDFGYLTMVGEADNQWTGPNGVKFGQFRTVSHGAIVNLPMSEVIVQTGSLY